MAVLRHEHTIDVHGVERERSKAEIEYLADSKRHRFIEDLLLAATGSNKEPPKELIKRISEAKAVSDDMAIAELRKLTIMEMLVKGYSVKEIAEETSMNQSLIYKVIATLKELASTELKNFFTDIIPLNIKVALERLNSIVKTSMEIANNPDLSAKERLEALSMAQESTMKIISMLSEDKSFLTTISNAIGKSGEIKE